MNMPVPPKSTPPHAQLDQRKQRALDLLNLLRWRIMRLADEAATKTEEHIVLVIDPMSAFVDAAERIIHIIGTRPAAALIPMAQAETILGIIAIVNPMAYEVLKRLKAPIAAGTIRVLALFESSVAAMSVSIEHVQPAPEKDDLPIVLRDGEATKCGDGWLLSAIGFAKFIAASSREEWATDAQWFKVQRYQERLRALWVAEQHRAQRRSFDAILSAELPIEDMERVLLQDIAAVDDDIALMGRVLDVLYDRCQSIS